VPSIEQAFAWLLSLPLGAVYVAALAFAFIENIFPPAPSDVLIGVCAFVAAAGGTPPMVTFGFVFVGSVSGAAVTYALGRRYGAEGLHARMEARGWIGKEQRIEAAYARYGLAALFVGRLITGVRSMVPMVAGAFRIHPVAALLVIGAASGIWYGLVVWLASRVGGNWDEYSQHLTAFTRWGAGVGITLALAGTIVVYLLFRRRRKR
jgi:uncharacterized protein (TIGR03382 family)